ANAFLAMKISFINAMSRVCELCGANVADVSKGMGTDARIGPQFLSAGLGWGGSCFPKDVQGMVKTAELLGYDFDLLKEVIAINEDQTKHFVDRIEKRLGGFQGKTVGLMGLAFKPNTDDIRDAKSLTIIDAILAGGGTVRAYDPVATDNVREIYPNLTYVNGADEVAEETDALVVVTEWNEFRGVDLSALANKTKGRLLFDGRRLYPRHRAEAAGFEYHTIGAQ
ncbi:UDP-glucose/GDP-mannose dehydrogenase family protein, partial [bacterium]